MKTFYDFWDSVHIASFLMRHTKESRYSHCDFDLDELKGRIRNCLSQTKGYRDGVIIVKIDPEGVWSSVVKLEDKAILSGEYVSRKADEEPRKSYFVRAEKVPAKAAFVVLYHHDVLIEKKENESASPWEAICLIATPTDDKEPPPMEPDTLIANHFELSGGTATNMSSDEFVTTLRASVLYWKDKAMSKAHPPSCTSSSDDE